MSGKRLSAGFIIVVTVILLVGFPNDARGENWVFYATTSGGSFFYDRDSIHNVSKDVIKVWTKLVYNDEGRAESLGELKKNKVSTAGFELLSESTTLWFLNCVDEQLKITQLLYYAKDGRVLRRVQTDEMDWTYIIPDSPMEQLMKTVCGEVGRTKK